MAPALFWSIKFERRVKKWPEPKKLLKQKINFFISINYAKEFLNSLHTGVVFSELFSRASNGRQYSRSWNFQLKISLCSVFQHAEFKFHGCSWIWDFGFALFYTELILSTIVERNYFKQKGDQRSMTFQMFYYLIEYFLKKKPFAKIFS